MAPPWLITGSGSAPALQARNAVCLATFSPSFESGISGLESVLENSESAIPILESDYRNFSQIEMTCPHVISTQTDAADDASANGFCDVTLVQNSESQ